VTRDEEVDGKVCVDFGRLSCGRLYRSLHLAQIAKMSQNCTQWSQYPSSVCHLESCAEVLSLSQSLRVLSECHLRLH
jgi:hypothetical protein